MHQIMKKYKCFSNGLNDQKVYEMGEMGINSIFPEIRKFTYIFFSGSFF